MLQLLFLIDIELLDKARSIRSEQSLQKTP